MIITEQLRPQPQQEYRDGMLVQPLQYQHCSGLPNKMKKEEIIKIPLKLQIK